MGGEGTERLLRYALVSDIRIDFLKTDSSNGQVQECEDLPVPSG